MIAGDSEVDKSVLSRVEAVKSQTVQKFPQV